MEYLGVHRHDYTIFRKGLTPEQIANVIFNIKRSNLYEIDDLTHIFRKGTNDYIGYIGADNDLEIVDEYRTETRPFRKNLKKIFKSV